MKAKTVKIFLDDRGSFLGRGKGCLIVRDRKGNVEKYPLFENEVGEVHIRIGNSVSSGALATCAFWGIDLLILTQRGTPVAYLKSLEYDSHVKTRICQYEALKNGKGFEIAKKLVLSKIEGQNILLRKYGFRQHDLMMVKEKMNKAEAKEFMRKLNCFFESKVEIPRIKHGNRQELETLINEEALLLAKYLRSEKRKEWAPRLPSL